VFPSSEEVVVPKQPQRFRVLQVVCKKEEARKIRLYAKAKGVAVSALLRKAALLIVDANTPST